MRQHRDAPGAVPAVRLRHRHHRVHTKFIGGHGTSIGGCIVDSGKFDWTKQPDRGRSSPTRPVLPRRRVPRRRRPLCYIITCRTHGCATWRHGPFNAFLFLQGLETLHLRMPRHCENAQALAEHLARHPKVTWVNYPGLPSHPSHALAKKYLPKGAGAILGFGLSGRAAGQKFIEACKMASHLANIGDARRSSSTRRRPRTASRPPRN
ncbi:MAG: PLP-dependent transferase [Gemmataceae bacterium]